jgi:putative N6-adenine-specific DNA methylase
MLHKRSLSALDIPGKPMPSIRLIATCPEETKDVLMAEIKALGGKDIQSGFRAVEFSVSERVFFECHLKLRTASRILKVIKTFSAKTPEMLYSQARRIQWDKLFDVTRGYLIEGIPGDRGPEFMKANDISKRIREALQDVFMRHGGKIPKVDLEDPKVVIVAFIRQGKCIISFDTCGKALHKRGYRLEGHPAPIKETLAASLLKMAEYDGMVPFYDPMCGSGTIAIEAAMMAMNKSPLIHRKKGDFLFEWLLDFDHKLWREVQDESRDDKLEEPYAKIFASDISEKFVDMAKKNALRARVEKHMEFFVGSFFELPAPADSGLLITNLPYGDRLMKDEDLKAFFKEIGDTLKKKYTGWRACLLAAVDSPYKFVGLKPTKKIPVLNGNIKCTLLIFDIYAGTKRTTTKAKAKADEED